MNTIALFRQLAAFFSTALAMAFSVVLLYTYYLSYLGGHYAVIITTDQHGEFWYEVVALIAIAVMGALGMVEWAVRIRSERL